MNNSSLGLILTAGFAMFSMFFGSGNLVFPVHIGIDAQQSYLFSILGFALTGVCLPFLGLLGIMQFKGDRVKYFSSLTPIPAFLLTLLMLALMGPLGIIPRCASVSYGGMAALFPSFPLWLFNGLFCLVITMLIWQRNKIVEIIGVYLTPIKLGSFIILIVIGLAVASRSLSTGPSGLSCLTEGVQQGYQTLDLIASFFFGSTIYEYLKSRLSTQYKDTAILDKKLLSHGIKASLFGGFLLTLCYVGFVLLGAKYAPSLTNIAKESYLMVIAKESMGSIAVAFVAVTLTVSCLATSTITASLFADFLEKDITRNRLNRKQSIVITMIVSYALSLLGFQGICAFLGQILEWIYPFLMLYAVIQIGRYIYTKGAVAQ